jgi:dolichol kinase
MTENPPKKELIQAKRTDFQWPRRLFHFGCGAVVVLLYKNLFTHSQAVYLLGFIACIVYIFEQIRVNYPELASKFNIYSKYLLRAEEQLKESAQVPYLMAILLTLISFPKPVAITAILTLALADPLSAIVGIKFGKTKIVPHKSVEGSLAFWLATFLSVYIGFGFILDQGHGRWAIIGLGFAVSTMASAFEMLPIKIDDNLTIPLFTAIITWTWALIIGLPTNL